jgi:hypothetical protein
VLACHARDAADWRVLAETLGVSEAECRWDTARTSRAVLECVRAHERFSANKLRRILPERAHPLVSGTLKAMALEGLIASTDQTERSAAPGSRGWRVALYTLTPAGAELAASLAPPSSFRGEMLTMLEEAS